MKFIIDDVIRVKPGTMIPYLFGIPIVPDPELLTDNNAAVHSCLIPKSIRANACKLQHETLIRPVPYINQLGQTPAEIRNLYIAKPTGGMGPMDASNLLYWMLFADISDHLFDQAEIEITSKTVELYIKFRVHPSISATVKSNLIADLNLAATYLLFSPRARITQINKIRGLMKTTDTVISPTNLHQTVREFNHAAAQLQNNEIESRILEGKLQTQHEIELELQKLSKSARNEVRRKVAGITATRTRRDETKKGIIAAEQKKVRRAVEAKKESMAMTADFSSLFNSLGE